MIQKPIVFINRPQKMSIKLLWHRYKYRNYFAPPMITFERSYWYDERWEIMCNDKKEQYNSIAIPTICGWCGQKVPAYPLRVNGSGGTNCHECNRTVDESYRDWLYRAEYLDGCQETCYQSGGVASGGPKHAPHSSFVPDDVPIYEFISPILVEANNGQFQLGDIMDFFRNHVKSRRHEFSDTPITTLISFLPAERDVPHKHKKEKPKDISNEPVYFRIDELDEDFDGNMFTVHLIPKDNRTWGATRSVTFSANSRKEALRLAENSIREQKLVEDLADYELVITNGAALSWARE